MNHCHVFNLYLTLSHSFSTSPYYPWSITGHNNQMYKGTRNGTVFVVQNEVIVNQFNGCGGNGVRLLPFELNPKYCFILDLTQKVISSKYHIVRLQFIINFKTLNLCCYIFESKIKKTRFWILNSKSLNLKSKILFKCKISFFKCHFVHFNKFF